MSRHLSRAHVGVDTSKADTVSGCMNGCVGFHKLPVSDYLRRGVSMTVSSMERVVAAAFQVWVACTCVCLL